jgi:NAD(P)-dependent dehydrogenase (short-subunit alcohol dehydrogenase family)
VVTGGASGIGLAMAARFVEEGASVVVFDIDTSGAERARQVGAAFCHVDVSSEEQTVAAADHIEGEVGPIELFCANAGILVQGGLEVRDDAWRRAWDVNFMPHLYAARCMVPRWTERGSGYLLLTASAAGLLTGLGALPYSVTKHAVISLAEWVAIEHRPAGVRVSCLCPQSVDTPMHRTGGHDAAALAATGMASGVLSPEAVAQAVVEGLRAETFLILPHPEVAAYARRKATDYDRWLRGMTGLRNRMIAASEAGQQPSSLSPRSTL